MHIGSIHVTQSPHQWLLIQLEAVLPLVIVVHGIKKTRCTVMLSTLNELFVKDQLDGAVGVCVPGLRH